MTGLFASLNGYSLRESQQLQIEASLDLYESA
jgi:hypothetical protein